MTSRTKGWLEMEEQTSSGLRRAAVRPEEWSPRDKGVGSDGAGGATARPGLTPQGVLQLQRLAGNAAVTRLLSGQQGPVIPVQRRGKDEDLDEMELPPPQLKRQARDGGVGPKPEPDRLRVPTKGKVGLEVTKPTAVIGGAAGAGLGSGYMGIGSEIVGTAGLLDAGLTFAGGYTRASEAEESGDTAGVKLGQGKMKTGAWGAAGGAVATTTAGVNIGREAGSTLAGLSAGAGALGIVGGGITALQGLWKVYKAAGKLASLSGLRLYTGDGRRWKERVQNREKWKLGVGTLKVALGALGIAAGALLIASNPVGWALGIAAAVAGGVWAITKIAAKISDLYGRWKAKKEIEKRDPSGEKRMKVKLLADTVAKDCSANAVVAAEMVGALGGGDANKVKEREDAIERQSRTIGKSEGLLPPIPKQEDFKSHDALSVLGVLNIPPEEALTPSGQERIEKKLSVAESA